MAIHFPKPKTVGRQILPPHQAAKGPATPLPTLAWNRAGAGVHGRRVPSACGI